MTNSRPSRRQFLSIAAATTAATTVTPAASVLSAQIPPAVPPGADQELVLTNGRIHTMDAQNTVASVLTVRNGRIVTVGNARPSPQPNARVIDLGGRTVVPGLIEAHIHSVSLTLRPGYHTMLENTTSLREMQETLAARRKSVPEGQWITSMGQALSPNKWAERRRPTLRELDDAVPDRPVLLFEGLSGPCVTNSRGKAYFDAMDAAAPVHPALGKVNVSAEGLIGVNPAVSRCMSANGCEWGVTPETAGTSPSANALFYLRRLQTFEDYKRTTIDMMTYSASLGLLTHLDQAGLCRVGPLHPNHELCNFDPFRMYDPWRAVYRDGNAFIRLDVNFQLENQTDPDAWELQERLRNNLPFVGDDMFRESGFYSNASAPRTSAAWFEKQRLIAQAGWKQEQTGGDPESFTKTIEGLERVSKEFNLKPLHWNIHDIQADGFRPDLLDRLNAIGVGVLVNARAGQTTYDERDLRIKFRTVLNNGIQAGICGDGVHIGTLNPWHHIAFAVTGLNPRGQQVNAAERITRQEALHLFTRGNSWFVNMENRIGSLEPGKLADMVVLNKDYFSVPEAELKQIRSVLTLLNGRIVHNDGTI
jgi:predicted amidohydrolase YtcJ